MMQKTPATTGQVQCLLICPKLFIKGKEYKKKKKVLIFYRVLRNLLVSA